MSMLTESVWDGSTVRVYAELQLKGEKGEEERNCLVKKKDQDIRELRNTELTTYKKDIDRVECILWAQNSDYWNVSIITHNSSCETNPTISFLFLEKEKNIVACPFLISRTHQQKCTRKELHFFC